MYGFKYSVINKMSAICDGNNVSLNTLEEHVTDKHVFDQLFSFINVQVPPKNHSNPKKTESKGKKLISKKYRCTNADCNYSTNFKHDLRS